LTANFLAALVSDRLLGGTKIRADDVELWSLMGTAMPDHHSIMQEVINSKTVLNQMGQPAAALSGKIDAISVEMHKALQLRDGYKKAQATLATLKKAADDRSKKVDDAKAKNDSLYAKHLDAAKDVEERAKKVQEDSSLKGDKNKAIAQAVNRI